MTPIKFFLEPGFSAPAGFKKALLESDDVGRIPGTLLPEETCSISSVDSTRRLRWPAMS